MMKPDRCKSCGSGEILLRDPQPGMVLGDVVCGACGRRGKWRQTKLVCRWCGCPKAGDPSDYYHEKSCHRTDALRRLKAAEAAGDTDAIKRLRREVEAASYVGD